MEDKKMCIIAIKKSGLKMFDKEQLAIMFANNPDGAGFMFYDAKLKKVVIKKGFMTLKSLLKALSDRDYTDTNVILHFRIGTSGQFNKLNCHPYPIYQKNRLECVTNLAMAHNGILRGYIPPENSDINDTQVFIQNVLKWLKKGFIYDADKMNLIGEIIGSNKLAFLDNKNEIRLVGEFIEDNGYIYSNSSYKQYKRTKCAYKPKKVVADAHASASSQYSKMVDIWGEPNEENNDFWRWFDNKFIF